MIARRVIVASVVALAFGAGEAEPAGAQAALLGPGAIYLGAGVSRIATGELDDRLAANGYPTFGGTTGAINLGAYRLWSSGIMLGLEWHALPIGEEAHEGHDVALFGGYGTFGVGYMVTLSPRARMYPRFGIGGGGLSLLIESAEDTVGFNNVLADPRPEPDLRDPNLSRDGWVFDLGAGAEFLPAGRSRGVLIGVRVGYLAAPFNSSWDLVNRGKASGGPDATISGPYIRIVIGGAWRQ